MFGKNKETVNEWKHYDIAHENMQQFAIYILMPIDQNNPAIVLNNWCMDHNCFPVSFRVINRQIYAVVKKKCFSLPSQDLLRPFVFDGKAGGLFLLLITRKNP